MDAMVEHVRTVDGENAGRTRWEAVRRRVKSDGKEVAVRD